MVFSLGGIAMLVFGAAMLTGRKFALPMLGLRTRSGSGVVSVFSLGVFSGAASACCAPVLAGVVAVSGAAASFPAALAIGIAYVFGMVAPLSAMALVWDGRDWGAGRLATRTVRIGAGRFIRSVPLGSALSGGLLVAMGLLTVGLAVRGPSMGSTWELRLTAWLDHLSKAVVTSVPAPVGAFLVLAAAVGVVVAAVRQRRTQPKTDHSEKTMETNR